MQVKGFTIFVSGFLIGFSLSGETCPEEMTFRRKATGIYTTGEAARREKLPLCS
jgi:hypothetical protein